MTHSFELLIEDDKMDTGTLIKYIYLWNPMVEMEHIELGNIIY